MHNFDILRGQLLARTGMATMGPFSSPYGSVYGRLGYLPITWKHLLLKDKSTLYTKTGASPYEWFLKDLGGKKLAFFQASLRCSEFWV